MLNDSHSSTTTTFVSDSSLVQSDDDDDKSETPVVPSKCATHMMGRLGQDPEVSTPRNDLETGGEDTDKQQRRNFVSLMEGLDLEHGIRYISYESELQMPSIMKLIQKDLSEPYSVYTYRYFIHNWPKLCFLAIDGTEMVGAIVCKLDVHKQVNRRGYIAMLAVDEKYRRKKIGECALQ